MIEEDTNGLEIPAPVELYTIDLTTLGGPTLYLTPQSQGNGNGLRFGGHVFAPSDIQGDGFELSGKGTLPRPKVRITNLVRQITALVESLGDCVGGVVTRTRTYAKYLDDKPDADSSQKYPEDVYYIQQLTGMNRLYVEWQLSSVIDLQNRMLPRRKISRSYCSHIYRYYNPSTGQFDNTQATCPYAGNGYYDRYNKPVEKAKDQCSKDLAGCRLRFGRQPLPTRAFPGAGRFSGK